MRRPNWITKEITAGPELSFPIAVVIAAWQRGPAMDSQTNSEIWFHAIGTLITASLVISIALVLISAIR
jgi:hypothetical protein